MNPQGVALAIKTDSDIDGAGAKALRTEAKLTQREFWGAIGVSQACGSQYESGARRIPSTAKKQVFIRYVAGINFDTGTECGAQALRDFAANAASTSKGKA